MFKIENKSEIIYLYSVSRGGWIYKFPSVLDVLKFLAAGTHREWFHNIDHNQYLDDINMGNDMKVYRIPHSYQVEDTGEWGVEYEEIWTPRDYIFFDGLGRYIDFRIYKKEIQKLRNAGDVEYNVIKVPKKKRNKWFFYNQNKPEFRNGPVPGTGHGYNRRWLRHVKTTNERRQNSDPEVYDYVRPARRPNALPNLYDDIPRQYSKSWKDCTKKRKQWM